MEIKGLYGYINEEYAVSELTVNVTKQDHIQGNDRAPVTLLEYGDYECQFCGQAYYIIKKLQQDIGHQFRLVFRNFPLTQIHPHALLAACGAEAATQQGKFWEMHDLLFENQDALNEENLVSLAYVLKLDVDRFINDIDSDTVHKKIHDDFLSGVRGGVNGTPTFFINGHRHNGSYSYAELRTVIEQAVNERVNV
jgi:protein-disulfide isomerase